MNWLNTIGLLLLVAGHTEILTTIVNRSHGLRIHQGPLKQLRHLHDALMPAFPVILLFVIGFRGHRLMFEGHWAELSVAWKLYLGICAMGVVGLCFSMVRYLLKREPAQLVAKGSQTVDIESRLGIRPVGEGPFQFLTKIPGNELFQLDLSEKIFRLQNLPAEWNGISIMHLTDTHFIGTVDKPYFEEVCRVAAKQQADMIVFTGDLMDELQFVDWIPDTLGKLSSPLGCYFILGNHDWDLPEQNSVRQKMTEQGWIDVAGKCVSIELAGKTLAIGGSECPWMGKQPDFSQVADADFRLLLSHTPDNLSWAKRNAVDLVLAGHNHGGQVVLPVIGPVYTPSLHGCKYSGGSFSEGGTVMHVSRGLSGRHPLRLNCKPELTKLVLLPEQLVAGQTVSEQVSLTI